ncbi:DM13 and DOMON_DOH domain-containing protein skeletor isoform X2 [Cotesia typhae]|uniref:DM13 and DOMON_DOH domain-containing protein skeletor isoform X2 n=1 Tax=Cotesia typhae TaxID=2053667 RepID=UPI003D68BF42
MKTPYYLSSFKSFVFLVLLIAHCCDGEDYYGKLIGKLSELNHGLSGEVYAVDARTLFIKDFNYDGEGPAAYFYAGNSRAPIINGFRIRDEKGNTGPLKQYRKKKITLTLPEGKTLKDIKWFSVYCDAYSVNFGDVRIPRGFDFPKPQKLAGLNGVHGVRSDPVVVVDAQTLLVPSFSYDGEAPDAKFWVGSGAHPSSNGIRLPDENGRESPLRAYDRKTIVLTLPGDITIHQLGHFGIWCEAFTVDFGHIQIPSNLNVPPSLKMLGISPQNLEQVQGQIGPYNQPHELYLTQSSSSSSASSSASVSSDSDSTTSSHISDHQHHPTFDTASLLINEFQRPTTYRPPTSLLSNNRRAAFHPHVQIIHNQHNHQSIDRTPGKSSDLSTIQSALPSAAFQYPHNNNNNNKNNNNNSQRGSYAHLRNFHGNQRLDSYVSYSP